MGLETRFMINTLFFYLFNRVYREMWTLEESLNLKRDFKEEWKAPESTRITEMGCVEINER